MVAARAATASASRLFCGFCLVPHAYQAPTANRQPHPLRRRSRAQRHNRQHRYQRLRTMRKQQLQLLRTENLELEILLGRHIDLMPAQPLSLFTSLAGDFRPITLPRLEPSSVP